LRIPANPPTTVHALERGQREIFPNWRGRALVLANRLLPGLIDRIMTREVSRSPRDR
jgi:hypothetical protein